MSNLAEQVKNAVLSFDDSFTIKDIIDKLSEQGVYETASHEEVLSAIDYYINNGFIKPISFSDRFYH